MDNNDKYWYAFAYLIKASSAFVNKLYSHFKSIEKAWNADFTELSQVEGIHKNQISAFLEERKTINPQDCMDYTKERGLDFIHPEDERYPESLRYIDNPPTGLFMLGDITKCDLNRTLAVVGSRRASENAKITLRKILEGFSNTNICIVSGLAEGIDTVAHKTALDNNCKTIAIIGSGFDKLYPKSNTKLFNRIIESEGAVLTEYRPDIDAIGWHFPIRNRIVSGLSKGVLIAEAALKSGAMITAKLALEQGKELMCMPGLISNPNTEGIYSLLKTGAGLVTNAQDINDFMGWQFLRSEINNAQKNFDYSPEELTILDLLRKDSLTMDELIIKTNLNINDLMVILTKLELDGIIVKNNTKKYSIL